MRTLAVELAGPGQVAIGAASRTVAGFTHHFDPAVTTDPAHTDGCRPPKRRPRMTYDTSSAGQATSPAPPISTGRVDARNRAGPLNAMGDNVTIQRIGRTLIRPNKLASGPSAATPNSRRRSRREPL